MLYAKILRSEVAHARIRSVDTSAARTMPGVIDALCGADLVGKVKPWGDLMQDLLVGDHTPFAVDKVLYEGQELAAVVAETKYQALDALEAIEVDLEELRPTSIPRRPSPPGAALIQEGISYEFGDGNIFDRYRVRIGDIDAAEQDADVVVRQRFTTNRQAGAALDPHGCIASYDSFTRELTIHSSTQSIYMVRDVLADVLQIPRNKVRVIIPEVGAGFGSKAQIFPYEVIASIFSMRLGRPVHLVLGAQGDLPVRHRAQRPGPLRRADVQAGRHDHRLPRLRRAQHRRHVGLGQPGAAHRHQRRDAALPHPQHPCRRRHRAHQHRARRSAARLRHPADDLGQGAAGRHGRRASWGWTRWRCGPATWSGRRRSRSAPRWARSSTAPRSTTACRSRPRPSAGPAHEATRRRTRASGWPCR